MNGYLAALQKYALFTGRSHRTEYWSFVLVNLLISIAIGFVVGLVSESAGSALSGLYSLAVLIPGIAVSVRRLHDTNRSGFWLLISLVPVIGWLVVLFFMVQDSDPGSNQFGSNPKLLGA